jgi:hypothetical protein
MKKIDEAYHITLTDVMQEQEAIPVVVQIISVGSERDGVMLELDHQEYEDFRIVVENKEGKLICHVWATIESLGQDPTHSIEIERR